jgi:isomaltose glucohydrolase
MRTYTDQLDALQKSSIRIICENQSSTGGYVASPNFAVYNYSWFRDGAFIAYAMSLVGEIDSAKAFHIWAAENINKRSTKISDLISRNRSGEQIDPEDHLHCRYSIDGLEADEDWTNFQLDGFGTWLWAANEFRNNGNILDQSIFSATTTLIPYLIEFWATPSFDWWEESFGEQHVSTIGCISAGLLAIQGWQEISPELRASALATALEIKDFVMEFGVVNQHLTKWIGTDALDGSLAALIAPMNWITETEIARKTLYEISHQLGDLGTHRHVNDVYFGGGPWPLLSVFLALGKASMGETDSVKRTLEWLVQCTNEAFELPEQLPVDLLYPEERDGWIEKWGTPAQPLLWSHAMFLILKKKVEEINA